MSIKRKSLNGNSINDVLEGASKLLKGPPPGPPPRPGLQWKPSTSRWIRPKTESPKRRSRQVVPNDAEQNTGDPTEPKLPRANNVMWYNISTLEGLPIDNDVATALDDAGQAALQAVINPPSLKNAPINQRAHMVGMGLRHLDVLDDAMRDLVQSTSGLQMRKVDRAALKKTVTGVRSAMRRRRKQYEIVHQYLKEKDMELRVHAVTFYGFTQIELKRIKAMSGGSLWAQIRDGATKSLEAGVQLYKDGNKAQALNEFVSAKSKMVELSHHWLDAKDDVIHDPDTSFDDVNKVFLMGKQIEGMQRNVQELIKTLTNEDIPYPYLRNYYSYTGKPLEGIQESNRTYIPITYGVAKEKDAGLQPDSHVNMVIATARNGLRSMVQRLQPEYRKMVTETMHDFPMRVYNESDWKVMIGKTFTAFDNPQWINGYAGPQGIALGPTSTEHTAVHEMGHIVDLQAKWDKSGSHAIFFLWQDHMKDVKRDHFILGSKLVRPYSASNHKEFFADAFGYYITDPVALHRTDPRAYSIMQKFYYQ